VGIPANAKAASSLHNFDIPAGPLSRSIVILAGQANVSIGDFGHSMLSVRRAPRLKGRLSLDEALRRLLAGSGYGFRTLPGGQVIILPRQERPVPSPPPPTTPTGVEEVIVTASKRDSRLADYPGAVAIVDIDPHASPIAFSNGTSALIDQIPIMSSTYLGPGRDKIFVQGVADSSFSGYSTATVAQYFGETRLTYNAPDPDLNLYDIKRVEILEGPQATLYGAGVLGGILRFVPNDPDPTRRQASLAAGYVSTAHGDHGGDVAAMINAPIVSDRVAVRVVGYHNVQPGYIDDSARKLKDINRTVVSGGRLQLRVEPGDGWTIDLGGVVQHIRNRDTQYALAGLPPLTVEQKDAQPSHNDYQLYQLVGRKRWSDLELVSATGYVRQNALDENNGLVPPDNDAIVAQKTSRVTMISNETRLSGKSDRWSWVGGVSGLDLKGAYDSVARYSATVSNPSDRWLSNFKTPKNDILYASIYGEAERQLPARFSVTIGGRVEYSETTNAVAYRAFVGGVGDPSSNVDAQDTRVDRHFLTSAAISWKPSSRMLAFLRYQQGFRPGGFEAEPGGTPTQPELVLKPYSTDQIDAFEGGVRYGSASSGPWALALTLSHASWNNVQADVGNSIGIVTPSSGGSDATVDGIEAAVTARPAKALALQAWVFASRSRWSRFGRNIALSDVPELTAVAKAAYSFSPFDGADLTVRAMMRYVGKSTVEGRADIVQEQPAYALVSIGARLAMGRYGLALDATNLGDIRSNRFSWGNTFLSDLQEQTTPLRPRTIRIGFDAAF
jgi:outer membrane receptor protein involved in Fe transport